MKEGIYLIQFFFLLKCYLNRYWRFFFFSILFAFVLYSSMIPVHYCSLFSKISKLTFIITFFPTSFAMGCWWIWIHYEQSLHELNPCIYSFMKLHLYPSVQPGKMISDKIMFHTRKLNLLFFLSTILCQKFNVQTLLLCKNKIFNLIMLANFYSQTVLPLMAHYGR